MDKKLLLRIILDIALVFCAVLGLWWVIGIIGILCTWYYARFYEFPIAALLLDVIYSAPRAHFFNFQYVAAFFAVLLFLIIIVLKTKVRKDVWQKTF